jgi:predicted SprT family Zn-dependent metalloprotease
MRLLANCKTKYRCGGIRGYVADVSSGVAYDDGRFTVPLWAYKQRSGGYFIFYVSHELAHVLRQKKYGDGKPHDATYYKVFCDICPKRYQHYELKYKPSAKKYGISEKQNRTTVNN